MGIAVVSGATLMCPFGLSAGTLMATPGTSLVQGMPQATVFDIAPMVNIVPFGLCTSLMNPVTAAQTASASGVLTPGACTPVIPAPWMPGAPTTLVSGKPALTMESSCMCAYGGKISIVNPGAPTVSVG